MNDTNLIAYTLLIGWCNLLRRCEEDNVTHGQPLEQGCYSLLFQERIAEPDKELQNIPNGGALRA